ncbi:MAG: serine hydrolase domain-containing protein, partial [Pseudomonadota bacterium]
MAFTHCAKAQHFTDQRIQDIDQLIETRLDETRIPGAAVVLVEDGRIVHTRGFGLAEIETGTPATSDTVFAIGSVTKSFVSNTLLQLERDGLIDLEAPVITYLPAFQSASKAMSDTITVRQLMEHTSGFSTYDGNRNQTNSRRTDDALAKVSAQTMKYKLNRPVGRSFEYSNANYEVL